MKKTAIVAAILVVAAVLCLALARYSAPTRIAFVNYPEYVLAPLLDCDTGYFIRAEPVAWDDSTDASVLKKYDAIYFFGMGLKFNSQQQQVIDGMIADKVPLYVTASTRAETGLCTLNEEQTSAVSSYLGEGGSENFRRLLNYTRRELDGKRLFAPEIEPAKEIPRLPFFHLSEDEKFASFKDYMEFYRGLPGYKPENPVALFFGGNGGGDPGELIRALEARNLTVVALNGMFSPVERLREINPDIVIYMPHGRLSGGGADPDELINELKSRNIPLFCPIKVGVEYEEHLRDQRGMTGGMLSQSVTMPELDGGTTPFVLAALFRNRRGLLEYRAIPDRVERFAELVAKTAALKQKPNSEKKLAIVYYKGPGLNALEAGGIEVGDSMLNVLRELKKAGYTTGELPETPQELGRMIQENAAVFGEYAKGAMDKFLKNPDIVAISAKEYADWIGRAMPDDLYRTVTDQYGPFPGGYFSKISNGEPQLALGVLKFGNIVLLPQSLPGVGGDSEKLVHGAKQAPPHHYIAIYLWIRYGFGADAMMHFGTHGSLEFTPWKDVALSSYDWPDVLVGEMPHYYLYVISNIGEAVIAKRRSYATMVSHLTAPFMNSGLYGKLSDLDDKMHTFETSEDALLKAEYEKSIIRAVQEEKLDGELKFSDDFKNGKLNDEDYALLHNYLHEINNSKVNRGLYVIGRPYTAEEADETAKLMTVDALADARFRQDLAAGKIDAAKRDDERFFRQHYLEPAGKAIDAVLAAPEKPASDAPAAPPQMAAAMTEMPKLADGSIDRSAIEKMMNGKMPPAMAAAMADMSDREIEAMAAAMMKPRQTEETATVTAGDAITARRNLLASTQLEFDGILNGFNGGYLAPSPGGDPVSNPASVPAGRNLYGVDPERTPTKESFAVGKQLGEALIAEKLKTTGNYPKKVAFTLWGGEFIRSRGVNIGEIFFLLGVEPVWDSRGRVLDVQLVPMSELKRPRIDVAVQTSGQFRGAASSRIMLIDKAVELALNAGDDGEYENYVKSNTADAARVLIENGLSPAEAREFSSARIFGALDGGYSAGIMGLTESGDRWEDSSEIAERYLRNMSAVYTRKHWAKEVPGGLEAGLQNADTVVQPRSNNTNGPLSLDHVYEFMGGMNLAVKNVTGNEPDAYFNDLRTPGRPRIQEAGQAAMVEARTTVLNPKYITEMMREGPGGAESFAEVFRNTYGWEVMKPDMLDDHLWEEYKKVYVDDSLELGIREYFEEKNPYALEEMTAVMLETIRKGMWDADEATVAELVELHVELVQDHGPGCSGFVCDNAKLRSFIADNTADAAKRENYRQSIDAVRNAPSGGDQPEEISGMALKEDKPITAAELVEKHPAAVTLVALAVVISTAAVFFRKNRRKKQ